MGCKGSLDFCVHSGLYPPISNNYLPRVLCSVTLILPALTLCVFAFSSYNFALSPCDFVSYNFILGTPFLHNIPSILLHLYVRSFCYNRGVTPTCIYLTADTFGSSVFMSFVSRLFLKKTLPYRFPSFPPPPHHCCLFYSPVIWKVFSLFLFHWCLPSPSSLPRLSSVLFRMNRSVESRIHSFSGYLRRDLHVLCDCDLLVVRSQLLRSCSLMQWRR